MSSIKLAKLKKELSNMKAVYSKSSTSQKTKDILKKAMDKINSEISAHESKSGKKPTKTTSSSSSKAKTTKSVSKAPAKKKAPLSALEKLKKRVKGKAYGAYKKNPVSDLERDAAQPALPIGKRTAKESGETYYEYRANRLDVKQPPKRYPKLADGGMMAKGGEAEKPMSYYKYETPKVRIYWKGKVQPLGMFKSAEEAYEVIKKEFAEANAFGFGVKMSDYEIHTPDKIIKLADGGMMADGGMVKEIEFDDTKWYLTYIDPTHFFLSNSPDFKGNAFHIGQFRGKEPQWLWNDVRSWLKSNGKMASGGMMAKGGKLEAGVYRVGKPTKVSPILYEQKIVEIFDNGDIATASDYGRKLTDFNLQKYPIISKEQLDAQYKMASGGMMAKGGEINKKVKDWYIKTYPSDDLGQEINDKITFKSLWAYMNNEYDVYEVLEVGDSIVRERIFEKLSEVLGVDYNVVYNKWLMSAEDGGMMAKGGLLQHGLEYGDKIINSSGGNVIEVETKSGDRVLINLDKGKRIKKEDYTMDSASSTYKDFFMADGGETSQDKLTKELQRLQRELNSSRLGTYREGDNSEEEMARQSERKVKLERFNEILEILRQSDKKKVVDQSNSIDSFANGGELKRDYLVTFDHPTDEYQPTTFQATSVYDLMETLKQSIPENVEILSIEEMKPYETMKYGGVAGY